ncbi:GNAT family N-acetyltransferase [Variovorax sp. Root411]|uniref:GNAT family N-acetyltransferase n=1 Tax=Variovorax sp. Root411 TaxID=1736530 RepID=UPI0006FE8AD6|nr:GNAT family protein [Variovorax sp. Root411]KQW56500.1 acetyltransferase [Variovorax sp. Root411]
MPARQNDFGQSIGPDVPDWSPRALPPRQPIEGRFCTLEPLDVARHADDLYAAYAQAPDARDWTYLFSERSADLESIRAHAERAAKSTDPMHFAVIDRQSGRAVGTLALMRIDPAHGSIEVGSVTFSPLLKQTPMSTEAQYLLMKLAFDELGYRRYEWKCDNFNEPSKRAATRLGFQFEGVFRQAVVYKGRSRDTAWFSIIDSDWPALRTAFERWLAPGNFDAQGRQRMSLDKFRLASS